MMVTSRADYEVARSAEEKNYKTLIALSKEVRSWMSVFGLTPSSRMLVSKLAGEKKQEVDEVFDFLM
jgi:sulfur relay (sulfurtransferase) DsrC/TusE family protein